MSNFLNDIAQTFNRASLGLVPNGRRSVTPVPADLLALVPKPTGRNEVVKKRNADPMKDTVPLIQKLIKRQAWQGKKLAAALKGSTVEETVRNNWDFFMNHIQYVQDPDTRETVRSLRRTVHEGKGDCDCFVNGLGNLLYNQGIRDAKLRVAAYNNADQVSHIYIKVPGAYSGMLTLDPVIHKFNYEEPFTYKKDFPMTLESLDGLGSCSAGSGSGSGSNGSNNNQVINKLNVFVNTQTVVDQGLIPTQQFLEKNKIPYTQAYSNELNASEFLVETPGGEIKVPSIMKPEQAAQLKQLMGSIGEQAQSVAEDLKSKFKWWWVAAAALGLFLIFGGKEKKASKNVNITLNGPGNRAPKRKAKKEKAKSRKQAPASGRVLPALSI